MRLGVLEGIRGRRGSRPNLWMDVRPRLPAPPHPLLGRGGGWRGVVTMALTTGDPQLSLWPWGAATSPFFLSPLPPQPHTVLLPPPLHPRLPKPPSPGEWKAQPPVWGQRRGGRASEAGVSAHPAVRTGEGAGRGSSPRSARSHGHPSSYTRFQAAPGPPPTPSPP